MNYFVCKVAETTLDESAAADDGSENQRVSRIRGKNAQTKT